MGIAQRKDVILMCKDCAEAQHRQTQATLPQTLDNLNLATDRVAFKIAFAVEGPRRRHTFEHMWVEVDQIDRAHGVFSGHLMDVPYFRCAYKKGDSVLASLTDVEDVAAEEGAKCQK
jgi:uncharacterized protein YegJ (DUF2314 family)